MEEAGNSKKKEPGTWMSFLVFGIAIAIILTGVVILDYDIHIVLLLALVFVCVVSGTLGYSFDEQVEFMKKALGQAMSAMIIFIFIGVIIASWIFSGTVQTLIYYGLQYISPAIFLPVGLLLCSLTSLSIGSSWGDNRYDGNCNDGNWKRNGDTAGGNRGYGDFRIVFW